MPEYERRVWKAGPRDWRWAVRHRGPWTRPFAEGRSTSRAKAVLAVDAAIDEETSERAARWTAVR